MFTGAQYGSELTTSFALHFLCGFSFGPTAILRSLHKSPFYLIRTCTYVQYSRTWRLSKVYFTFLRKKRHAYVSYVMCSTKKLPIRKVRAATARYLLFRTRVFSQPAVRLRIFAPNIIEYSHVYVY